MRLFVDSGVADEDPRPLAVSIDNNNATVADLAVALHLPDSALVVNGAVHLGDVALADVALVEGARVGPLGPNQERASGIGRSWVGVVSGPHAGAVRRLDADGAVTIGRGPFNDLDIDNSSVSVQHAVIERTKSGMCITDFSSTNGTWLGDRPVTKRTSLPTDTPVRVGSSVIEFIEVNSEDKPLASSASHADIDGRVLLNRPPRGPVSDKPAPVEIPEALPDRKNPTLKIVSLVVPLLVAAVMVVAFGSFRYALFALLSPMMLLGNHFSGRRSARKQRAGDARNRGDAIAALNAELEEAERLERHRRREAAPHLLEVRRRVELPSNRLWERRLDSPDALTIGLGTGTIDWDPTDRTSNPENELGEDVAQLLDGHTSLENVEVLADLRSGPVGFVGDEDHARKAARSGLLQLAAHHGPADISVAILTTDANKNEWSWAQWLPHSHTPSGGVRILSGKGAESYATGLLESLTNDKPSTSKLKLQPAVLLIVDDLEVLHRRSSSVRQLLECTDRNVFGMVVAPVQDRLPASVATVIDIDKRDGEFVRTTPAQPGLVETGIIDGVSTSVASEIARSMARFDDPEIATSGGAVPTKVRLRDVLPAEILADAATASSVQRRWHLNKRSDGLATPIGRSEAGVFSVDLVHDGPHALVAGTTGAGKSEFLRTLVLGLAVHYDPDDLVFVLIDYKGGSAFDKCGALPHVVGLVTDLDDHLAQRALHSLEAELHHRETVLRLSQASDIAEYRRSGSPKGPLPRLVVVIDEFATMRTELPDFVSSLVGIAQRGRSLGVHLILATQRPSGAVDANIRANTNLRVALRVQDAADSTDVIDDPGAAHIVRDHPGRALVRRGEGDLVLVQTAYVSGPMDVDGPPVRVGGVPLDGSAPEFKTPTAERDSSDGEPTTSIDHVVQALTAAASGRPPARSPWLEELPTHFANPGELESLEPGDEAHVVLAVADEPRRQRRVTRGWDLDDGHLAVIGCSGSGVTTTLRSAVTALGADPDGRTVWVFPVDHGAGGLDELDRFPHVAEVITGSDETRQARLLQFVSTTLDERRADHKSTLTDRPLIIVAIDGIAGFCEVNDVSAGTANGDLLTRIGRDGPSVGIYLLVGAGTQTEVPRLLRNTIHQTIVLKQADHRAYTDFGIRAKNLPAFVPGRALFGTEPVIAQVVDWEAAATAGLIEVQNHGAVPSIEGLATEVDRSALPLAKVGPDLKIPIGLSDSTREPAVLDLRAGDHALIAGPARSGRTTTLRGIARSLRHADSDVVLVAIVPTGTSAMFDDQDVFDAAGSADDLDQVLKTAQQDDRRWIIFVDDADRIDLESGALFDLARKGPSNVTIIAAVRSSTARQSYGHWTRFVRAAGTGLLLEADPVADGELLAVRLPRDRRLESVPGRGYLVHAGTSEVVQVAL